MVDRVDECGGGLMGWPMLTRTLEQHVRLSESAAQSNDKVAKFENQATSSNRPSNLHGDFINAVLV